MKTEVRNNGIKDVTVLIADEGKIIRRKNTEDTFGDELWLGYSYYINGKKLSEPHLDVPEDFEEIDAPVEEETVEEE